jgi:hypothetical protein
MPIVHGKSGQSGRSPKAGDEHPSILALCAVGQSGEKPKDIIRRKCREIVATAKSLGWTGPPFDPWLLASLNGIHVEETAEPFDGDGRIFPRRGRVVIQYRKGQTPERQRFTICHEIAHTCFPDAFERIRSYGRNDDDLGHRRFEKLCDIGAAELLFPREEFSRDLDQRTLSLSLAEELRQRYRASIDATLIRCVNLTAHHCVAAFLSDKPFADFRPVSGRHRVMYCFPSEHFRGFIPSGTLLPAETIVRYARVCPPEGAFPPRETWWIHKRPISFYVEAMQLPLIPEKPDYPTVIALLHSRKPAP